MVIMEWSFLSEMLDKVQSHSTVFGKVWMSVLFLFRIFILAAGVDRIWGDEQANMNCNTRSPGCRNSCYDRSFPLSHTRFWVLQILTVSTPTLVYLGHVLLVIRKESKARRHPQRRNMMKRSALDGRGKVQLKGVLLASYTMQLVFKVLLEVSFIVGQYFLYGFLFIPVKILCVEYLCQTPIYCFISRPTEKTIFVVFMLALAVFSILLNVVEILYLMVFKLENRGGSGRASLPPTN